MEKLLRNEPLHEKTNILVSYLVRHKSGCAATEDGYRLEISDLGSRGIVYLCSENKGADQLRGYREADLCLCFRICKKQVFSRCGSNTLQSIDSMLKCFCYVLNSQQFSIIDKMQLQCKLYSGEQILKAKFNLKFDLFNGEFPHLK